MTSKKIKDSQTETSHIVLPSDTNHFGNVAGGQLMYWMDIAGAVAAIRHCNNPVVTAHVDQIDFKHSIRLGEILILKARLCATFRTSMEVAIDAYTEDTISGKTTHTNSAYFVFVAIDKTGKPVAIPSLEFENDEERNEYESAKQRRELRLKNK